MLNNDQRVQDLKAKPIEYAKLEGYRAKTKTVGGSKGVNPVQPEKEPER